MRSVTCAVSPGPRSSRGTCDSPVETLAISTASTRGGMRSRPLRGGGRFSSRVAGRPLDPEDAARWPPPPCRRIPMGGLFAAGDATPGGFRTLAQVAMPAPTSTRAGLRNREPAPPAAEERPRMTPGERSGTGPVAAVIRRFHRSPRARNLERILLRRASERSKTSARGVSSSPRPRAPHEPGCGRTDAVTSRAAAGCARDSGSAHDRSPLSVIFDLGQSADAMMLVPELGSGACCRPRLRARSAQRLLGFPTATTASSCCRSATRRPGASRVRSKPAVATARRPGPP